MGYGQALSLPHSLPQQIKVRSPHALHRPPLSPPSFSLSLLFLPFVFRGSCCNSADHQQLPFQQHLTLPNPRPSLHPDIANASPPLPPHAALAGSHQEADQAKALLLRLACDMFTATPFQIQALPS